MCSTDSSSSAESAHCTDSVHFPKQFKDDVIEPKLKQHFRRDEFLGRINEIIYFVPFSRRELLQLVAKDLTFWQERAHLRHGVQLEWDSKVRRFVLLTQILSTRIYKLTVHKTFVSSSANRRTQIWVLGFPTRA